MADKQGEGGADAGDSFFDVDETASVDEHFFGVDEETVAADPGAYAARMDENFFGVDENVVAGNSSGDPGPDLGTYGDGYKYKHLEFEAKDGKVSFVGENAEGPDGGHNIGKAELGLYETTKDGYSEIGYTAQASVYENYGKIGDFDSATSGDDEVKLGVSLGVGGGGKLGLGDRDHDGYEEVTIGIDAGPISFEYVNEREQTYDELIGSTTDDIHRAVEQAKAAPYDETYDPGAGLQAEELVGAYVDDYVPEEEPPAGELVGPYADDYVAEDAGPADESGMSF